MRYLWLSVLIFYPLSVLATPTRDDLRKIEYQIQQEQQASEMSARKAAELSGEVKAVQQKMVKLAKTVQEKEDDLTRLEKRQAQMLIRQSELEQKLKLTNEQLVQITTGIQTLALRPSELALLETKSPLDTLRSQMVMGYSLPIIDGTNKQVRADLAELLRLRADIQDQIVRIKSAQSQLSDQSNQMDKLLQQKSMLQAQYQASQTESQKRVKTLGAQAKDLKELLDQLEQEKQKTHLIPQKQQPVPAQPILSSGSFERAKGRLPFPIRGTITTPFGSETISGSHTKGITITGRSSARAIAPFDGVILFAGPFKTYGQLVIIDHGDNYLTLLAGMEQLNTTAGQEVLAGEPIGQVKETKPELYVEIRKNGQAIDPTSWFMRK